MRKTFDVHVYPVARMKITGIEAYSPEAAIKRAEQTDFHELLKNEPKVGSPDIEYAEEIAGFLVDEQGDPEHERSVMYDVFEGRLVPHGFAVKLLRKLLAMCVEQRNCCEEALADEWDRSDDGFACMRDRLAEVLEEARENGFGDWVDQAEKESNYFERGES